MNLHTKLSGFYFKITLTSNDVNRGVATRSRGSHAYPPTPTPPTPLIRFLNQKRSNSFLNIRDIVFYGCLEIKRT